MVFQKIKADRAARQNRVGRGAAGQDRVAGPVDEKTRQWISEVVRTPRQ
jgi:hypothetical protein